MTAAYLLLALGVFSLLGLANAMRPARGPFVLVSWPAAWATAELAPHLIAFSALGALALSIVGALDEPVGLVGLVCVVAADGLALPLVVRARRTIVDPSKPSSGSSRRCAPTDPGTLRRFLRRGRSR